MPSDDTSCVAESSETTSRPATARTKNEDWCIANATAASAMAPSHWKATTTPFWLGASSSSGLHSQRMPQARLRMPIQCVMVSVGTLPLTNICCAIRFTAKNGRPCAKYSDGPQGSGERRAVGADAPAAEEGNTAESLDTVGLFPGGDGSRNDTGCATVCLRSDRAGREL